MQKKKKSSTIRSRKKVSSTPQSSELHSEVKVSSMQAVNELALSLLLPNKLFNSSSDQVIHSKDVYICRIKSSKILPMDLIVLYIRCESFDCSDRCSQLTNLMVKALMKIFQVGFKTLAERLTAQGFETNEKTLGQLVRRGTMKFQTMMQIIKGFHANVILKLGQFA